MVQAAELLGGKSTGALPLTLPELLLNRSTDRTVKAKVRLPAAPASSADVRTLSGEDYNTYGAVLSGATERISKTFTRKGAPHSAQMISFSLPPK